MSHVRIIGTGSYLPEKILTNDDLAKLVDTNDTWIRERTGIRSRHVAASHETTTSLAKQAADRAIEAAGIDVNELDLIIVGTATPDHFFPSTACELQGLLGIKHDLPAFDLSAACSGFLYGLVTAEQFILSGLVGKALVIGTERLSKVVDWQDRSTCVLFGDGAGACVLSASTEPGILTRRLHAKGSLGDILKLQNRNTYDLDEPSIAMNGREVFKFAVNAIVELSNWLLADAGLSMSDIDWFIPHQANLRILQAVSDRMGFPMERISQNIETQGNTSAASVPLALDDAIRTGKVKSGDRILLEGFGGGMTWGGVIIQL